MIYWKQQLILIKPSQNIKLIEPTAVQCIHNSWSKSFKIFIPIECLQSLYFFLLDYFSADNTTLRQAEKWRVTNICSDIFNQKFR